MKWIIIDKERGMALYGIKAITLTFSSREVSEEVANQFFEQSSDYFLFDVSKLNLKK